MLVFIHETHLSALAYMFSLNAQKRL